MADLPARPPVSTRFRNIKRLIVGRPLSTERLIHERLGKPTALAVFAPATAGDGAAKLAGRVGAILRDAGARVGYDAATNLTYAPMDPLELLARARAAIRQGRPDPAYPWLRSFAGTTPRTSGGVLVPGDARTEQ